MAPGCMAPLSQQNRDKYEIVLSDELTKTNSETPNTNLNQALNYVSNYDEINLDDIPLPPNPPPPRPDEIVFKPTGKIVVNTKAVPTMDTIDSFEVLEQTIFKQKRLSRMKNNDLRMKVLLKRTFNLVCEIMDRENGFDDDLTLNDEDEEDFLKCVAEDDLDEEESDSDEEEDDDDDDDEDDEDDGRLASVISTISNDKPIIDLGNSVNLDNIQNLDHFNDSKGCNGGDYLELFSDDVDDFDKMKPNSEKRLIKRRRSNDDDDEEEDDDEGEQSDDKKSQNCLLFISVPSKQRNLHKSIKRNCDSSGEIERINPKKIKLSDSSKTSASINIVL